MQIASLYTPELTRETGLFVSTALRSRSGRSIINGNWAIDRPGKYEGGGTMFTYKRPNEISSTAGESFLAEGPTNEILDVYVSLGGSGCPLGLSFYGFQGIHFE